MIGQSCKFVVHAGIHSSLQNFKSFKAISCNNVNICILTSVNLCLFFSFLVGILSSCYFFHTDHSVTFCLFGDCNGWRLQGYASCAEWEQSGMISPGEQNGFLYSQKSEHLCSLSLQDTAPAHQPRCGYSFLKSSIIFFWFDSDYNLLWVTVQSVPITTWNWLCTSVVSGW